MTKKEPQDMVENLNSKRDIESNFALINKKLRNASSGRKYIDLTLSDKTGQINGRIFSKKNVEEFFNTIKTGSIYKIKGRINEFPPESNKFNIVINSLTEIEDNQYILKDFVRTSDNARKDLVNELISVIKSIENPFLKKLLKSFFCDKEFTDQFYKAPAAMVHHHNYLGGLLDHTVEVLKICERVCEIFPQLNQDLLVTGVLLHDIGKIKAYDYDLIKTSMSKDGTLLDHLYMSADCVKEKMDNLNFPHELSNQVLHLILSHHGEVSWGWGSTVDPKLPEAVALHYADNLDAKVKEMFQK